MGWFVPEQVASPFFNPFAPLSFPLPHRVPLLAAPPSRSLSAVIPHIPPPPGRPPGSP